MLSALNSGRPRAMRLSERAARFRYASVCSAVGTDEILHDIPARAGTDPVGAGVEHRLRVAPGADAAGRLDPHPFSDHVAHHLDVFDSGPAWPEPGRSLDVVHA